MRGDGEMGRWGDRETRRQGETILDFGFWILNFGF